MDGVRGRKLFWIERFVQVSTLRGRLSFTHFVTSAIPLVVFLLVFFREHVHTNAIYYFGASRNRGGLPVLAGKHNFSTCQKLALSVPEPYTDEYSRGDREVDLNGTQYSRYVWDGPIDRESFEEAKKFNLAFTFKIVDSKLYLEKEGCKYLLENVAHAFGQRFLPLVELLILTMRMYDIPDMDFVVTINDRVKCGLPLIGYGNTRECAGNSGFTIPSYQSFHTRLGKKQFEALTKCLDETYPYDKRIPKAVWRGALTGVNVTSQNFVDNVRWKLNVVGQTFGDILDAGITRLLRIQKESTGGDIMISATPLKRSIDFEDFNKYAIIIDVDGMGWSSRFTNLLQFNTPILKQEMVHFLDFFGEFLVEGEHFFTFKEDLTDFIPQVTKLLEMYQRDPKELRKIAENAQRFAFEHASDLNIVRATAYTLSVYASKLTWRTEMEEGFVEVPEILGATNPSFPNEVYEGIIDGRGREIGEFQKMFEELVG